MESQEPSRKRKLRENSSLQEQDQTEDEQLSLKRSNTHNLPASFFDVKTKSQDEYSDYPHMSLDLELNLLPSKSTTKGGKPHKSSHILIDLNQNQDQTQNQNHHHPNSDGNRKKSNTNKSVSELGLIQRMAPRLISEDQKGTVDEDEEMMATVCMKCHMLVMLSKSLPACPNCKFMHSYEQSFKKLFFIKPASSSSSSSPPPPPRLSLLCELN